MMNASGHASSGMTLPFEAKYALSSVSTAVPILGVNIALPRIFFSVSILDFVELGGLRYVSLCSAAFGVVCPDWFSLVGAKQNNSLVGRT